MTGPRGPKVSPDAPVIPMLLCPNRRLYSSAIAGYVTQEQVEMHLRAGQEVVITDKRDGRDVTREVIAKRIADRVRLGTLNLTTEELVQVLLK